MPSDLASLGHLGGICVAVGDRACAEQALIREDSILKEDPTPLAMARGDARGIALALHRPSRHWADSLAKVVLADSVVPSVSFLPNVGGIFAEQPDRLVEQDRLYRLLGNQPGVFLARVFRRLALVGRGNPASPDSLELMFVDLPPELRAQIFPELQVSRVQLLLELQGLRQPSAATAEKSASDCGSVKFDQS